MYFSPLKTHIFRFSWLLKCTEKRVFSCSTGWKAACARYFKRSHISLQLGALLRGCWSNFHVTSVAFWTSEPMSNVSHLSTGINCGLCYFIFLLLSFLICIWRGRPEGHKYPCTIQGVQLSRKGCRKHLSAGNYKRASGLLCFLFPPCMCLLEKQVAGVLNEKAH